MRTICRIALALVGVTALAADDAESHTIRPLDGSRFDVVFRGRQYDASTDRTRFSYRIDPRGSVDSVRFVVGHGACGALQILVDGESPSHVTRVRTDIFDDESGIFGAEWTSTLRRWRATPFWFEVAGDVQAGAVRIAVEDEDRLLTGLVPGPSCATRPEYVAAGRSPR